MAVVQNPIQIHRYIGASTDTKPTIAAPAGLSPPTIGSTFYEYDTDIMYITYDGTNWVKKGNGHNVSGFGSGTETVDSAGTAQAIVTASTPAKRVMIQAQTDNTNGVAVGDSGVVATVATGDGILLYAGDWTPWINVDNLQDAYIDAIVTDEGVRFIYET